MEYALYLFSYLLGSIPFGLVLTHIVKGEDVRKKGSGNIGATNTFRVAGKMLGALTLFLDTVKGIIPIIIARYLYPTSELTHFACGFFAFIGHIFPIWLKFKGGKGVATAFGILAILSFPLALIAFITWAITFIIGRMVSLASIIASLTIIPTVWLSCYDPSQADSLAISTIITTMSLAIVISHRNNIKRIIKNKEQKL
jgi:glycerol-3-phosphate acyltransferase PlsY